MTASVSPGFLYAGLMIKRRADGTTDVRTLEFNCRMGDPETQPIMMRIRSNFAETVEAAIDGKLDTAQIDWDPRSALGVVLAAKGYPASPEKGAVITLPENTADSRIFHAGTKTDEQGRVVVSGGRVLCAVGLGSPLAQAQMMAYKLAGGVKFDGMQMRRDIGWRAINR